MRKTLMLAAAVAAIALSPALAQGRPGHAGPPAGMGAGPPITPPGQMGGVGAADRAADIASQRGQFGRDFGQQQRMTAQERQQMAQQYRAMAAERKAKALELAARARQGATFPAGSAERIREALNSDIEMWRDEFQVNRQAFHDARNRWLAMRGTMSPQEWAQRRADWFVFRDNWILAQRDWASARRTR